MTADGPSNPRRPYDDYMLRVRMTAEQRELLTRAAETVGLGLSTWLREAGLRAARFERPDTPGPKERQ